MNHAFLETDKTYDAIVIGASAGGLDALRVILNQLPGDFVIPILIVLHRGKEKTLFFKRYFVDFCSSDIIEPEDKEAVKAGCIYFAPPDYHMIVEMDKTLSLSVDPPVNWSRPSIDVLFESAAEVYKEKLVGVILTGANKDGSVGFEKIKRLGGLLVVQDPATATASKMPRVAIEAVAVDCILTLHDIGVLLSGLIKS